jgi:hypothetical protein
MEHHRDALLRDARRGFPVFYSAATKLDATGLDSLVMAHAALVVAMNASRSNIPSELRTEIERITNASEQMFTKLRGFVRECDTYKALPQNLQEEIRRVLFEMMPPILSSVIPRGGVQRSILPQQR